MPKDFLRRIEDCSFPLAIRDEREVNCAAVLVAANLIEAVLPAPATADDHERVAVILRITPYGRAELNRGKDTTPQGI